MSVPHQVLVLVHAVSTRAQIIVQKWCVYSYRLVCEAAFYWCGVI